MTESGSGSERTELSLDTLLSIMADRYRRRLLLNLLEHNPQDDEDIVGLADVSVAGEELAAFRVEMKHKNLPKLVDAGLIEWDRSANVVRKGPAFEEVRPLLVLLRDHEDALPDD